MQNILKNLTGYANSNAASKFYVCATAQNSDLDAAGFAALTWVEVGSVASRGETGIITNMLTYDVWGDTVSQKAKGLTNAGDPDIEVARLPTDPGQVILRTAGAVGNNNNYAFKELRADGAVGETGSIFYNRGLVTGPKRPGGRNEDFDIEMFTLGLQQQEVIVNPTTAGTAPSPTVAPAITGTEQVGETLTCSTGTWSGDATITYTYQWFGNGVAIAGATSGTYDLTASEEGQYVQCRVYATNDSGSAFAFSDLTGAIAAA